MRFIIFLLFITSSILLFCEDVSYNVTYRIDEGNSKGVENVSLITLPCKNSDAQHSNCDVSKNTSKYEACANAFGVDRKKVKAFQDKLNSYYDSSNNNKGKKCIVIKVEES